MSDGFRTDTVEIIGDSGSKTVFVYRRTVSYAGGEKTFPVQTATIVETATVQMFPINAGANSSFVKMPTGEIEAATHRAYFPYTTSVSVSDQIQETAGGSNDYYEVLRADGFEDHVRVICRLVSNRRRQ